jgi:hypothetical protein
MKRLIQRRLTPKCINGTRNSGRPIPAWRFFNHRYIRSFKGAVICAPRPNPIPRLMLHDHVSKELTIRHPYLLIQTSNANAFVILRLPEHRERGQHKVENAIVVELQHCWSEMVEGNADEDVQESTWIIGWVVIMRNGRTKAASSIDTRLRSSTSNSV